MHAIFPCAGQTEEAHDRYTTDRPAGLPPRSSSPVHHWIGSESRCWGSLSSWCRRSGAAAGDTIIEAPDPRPAGVVGGDSIRFDRRPSQIRSDRRRCPPAHNTARSGASPGTATAGWPDDTCKRWCLHCSGT